MKSSEAADLILKLLSARSAMQVGSLDRWTGYVFTNQGARVLQCAHNHATHVSAKNCAEKLAKRFARLEAARGVRP